MQHFTYAFTCKAQPECSYEVIAFHGQEQLDACFEFSLKLRTDAAGFSPEPLLNARASLTIRQGGDQITKNGCISRVHVLRTYEGKCYLECVLVPTLHSLALSRDYRTFIDVKLDGALEQLFQDCGLEKDAYAFRLTKEAPSCAYLCQYDESDLNFLLRRLAQQGWSFFFEFTDNRDTLVVTDSPGKRNDCPDYSDLSLRFAPPGSDHPDAGRLVQRFVRKVQAVPKNVRFKDWNYQRPDLRLEAQAEVAATGFGEDYVFGHTSGTSQTVRERATLLAEKLSALADRHMGSSDCPFLLPGQTFALQDHPLNSFNTRYLPLLIEHSGQAAMRDVAHPVPSGYSNRFVAIRADRTYRPLHTAPEPRITGGLHGFVECESKTYAQLDEHGRYRVRLCFDTAERQACKSSPPLRLMSPHAGNNYGLHFPLQGGTEVLVGYEYGDPDRPVILGALPNAEAPGPITDASTSKAHIRTPGGNHLHFNDTADKEHLSAHCPTKSTAMFVGAVYGDDADGGDNTTGE